MVVSASSRNKDTGQMKATGFSLFAYLPIQPVRQTNKQTSKQANNSGLLHDFLWLNDPKHKTGPGHPQGRVRTFKSLFTPGLKTSPLILSLLSSLPFKDMRIWERVSWSLNRYNTSLGCLGFSFIPATQATKPFTKTSCIFYGQNKILSSYF